jgi:uncharacterized protein (DUF58 family)
VALLAAAVLVAVLPWDPWWEMVALLALVAALAGTDVVLAPGPGSIPIERELPPTIGLGAPAQVRWTVANPTKRSLSLSVADQLAPSLRPSARRAHLRIPPGRAVTATVSIRPSRRGRFVPREMVVRVAGPLGLMSRQGARVLPGEVRVYPSFGSRREAELRLERHRILEVGLRSARGRGGGTEFEQLREHTPDDDSRHIDWGATARAQKLIVRTYRAERNQSVVVLLDGGRTMAGRVADVPRLEHAMDATMMLTAVAGRLGDRVGLLAFDRTVTRVVAPSAGASQLNRVTEALYELEAQLVESDYAEAFTQTVVRFRRRALLCLLTELDEALAETLLPALPLIARTHVLLVGAVRDPALESWADAMPDDGPAAYRKAAAIAARRRRHELVVRLRAAGALVVDALPGRLAPELTDAYLNVKAAGRL